MSEHTPGPWDASRDATPEYAYQATISDESGERIATAFISEANARLIAAAPDLLLAAQRALDDQYGKEHEGWDVAQGLMDAIDKATGA